MATALSINGVDYDMPEVGEGDWGESLTELLEAIRSAVAGIFQFGNSSTPNGAGTTYLRPSYLHAVTDGTEISLRAPAAGVIKALYVQAASAPSGGGLTFTVRVNGVDTSISCVMAAAATQAADSSHSYAVSAGDKISIKVVSTATTGAGVTLATLALVAG